MKPIEIHIEGYKIIISEDDKKDITYKPKKDDDNDDTIPLPNYPHTVPYPYVPPTIQTQDDWWRHSYVTWSHYDEPNFTNTNKTAETPVKDRMVGKELE